MLSLAFLIGFRVQVDWVQGCGGSFAAKYIFAAEPPHGRTLKFESGDEWLGIRSD